MGGKRSPPPPDYGPLARASVESARIMSNLGYAQMAESQRQFDIMRPIAEQTTSALMQSQALQDQIAREQADIARDYYAYQVGTFRPVEEGLVRDAEAFSTRDYQEQLARQAAAATGRAFGLTQQATERSMASMGVSPASGRFAGIQQQGALGLAAERASAMTGARDQAEQMGWARRLDVTGLGRGLPGASAAAYSGATQAGGVSGQLGTAALQSSALPGQQLLAGMGQAAGTIGAGQQMQIGGLSNIVGSQTSIYNTAQSQPSLAGQIIGTGLGVWAGSDRRLKRDIVKVGVDENTGINLYEFNYIDDPDHRYVGVMADEVLDVMPEAVHTDWKGYMAVNYTKLGIEFKEVAHG